MEHQPEIILRKSKVTSLDLSLFKDGPLHELICGALGLSSVFSGR